MNDLERSIGRIEGKMEALGVDVAEIKADVKGLQNFKWRVAGGAAVLVFILTIAAQLMRG